MADSSGSLAFSPGSPTLPDRDRVTPAAWKALIPKRTGKAPA